MIHHKPGYILFLLFTILSLCMTLVTVMFMKGSSYYQLSKLIDNQNKATALTLSATALAQAIITPLQEDEEEQDKENKEKKSVPAQQQIFNQILFFLNKTTSYELKHFSHDVEGTIQMYLSSEHGKLNLNGLYDFSEKKFFNEGKSNDKKKICEWLFNQISKITNQSSLLPAFMKHLENRTTEFNDVTELLEIKEFAQIFTNQTFISIQDTQDNKIFLTDIFTINTNSDEINPWLFSQSWHSLLGLEKQKNLSEQDQKKLIQSFKTDMNWEKDWNSSLKLLYKKDYTDLPKEIKSILTSHFEANIFSLLLKTNIKETITTIFTILCLKQIDNEQVFDIVKAYQI